MRIGFNNIPGLSLRFFCLLIFSSALIFGQETTKPVDKTPQQTKSDSEQDVETLVVETNLTTILMTATDKQSKFLTNLAKDDLSLVEDGVAQQITVFERETERPLSLTLVFDTSGSQAETLGQQKSVARSFLKHIFRPNTDKVAVVSFAGEAILQQSSTGDMQRIEAAIDRIEITRGIRIKPSGAGIPSRSTIPQIQGGTAIFDSLFLACLKIYAKAPPELRRAMILLTDGMDTRSKLLPKDAVNAAVYANTSIYGIGIGQTGMVDARTLLYLSGETGGKAFFPTNNKQLNQAFDDIEQELRSQYLIGYVPTNKLKDGKRRDVLIDITNPIFAKQKINLAYRNHYFVKRTAQGAGTR